MKRNHIRVGEDGSKVKVSKSSELGPRRTEE